MRANFVFFTVHFHLKFNLLNSFDPCYRPRQWCPGQLDRKILDLQNAEPATAWIMSFLAKCRAEKEEDKINTNGTIQDLQVTNPFLSMFRQDAIIKLRSPISPRNLIETPYKGFVIGF